MAKPPRQRQRRQQTEGPRIAADDLKDRFEFGVDLRFELFYALQAVTARDSRLRVHLAWVSGAREALSTEPWELFEALGRWPAIWPLVADAAHDADPLTDFGALLAALHAVPAEEYRSRMLLGALHDQRTVERLEQGRVDLSGAIASLPRAKREWLAFFDLYPQREDAPAFVALSRLCRDPARFKARCLQLVQIFWDRVFASAWDALEPQMSTSRAEKERLFQSCTLEEFFAVALLRIEVDAREQVLRAIRGGYRLPFARLASAHLFPSAFNDRRYWSAYESADGRVRAFIPFFDPALALEPRAAVHPGPDPELDPALIFRALGDSTRFGIVRLIAETPRSSADLARELKLSRATISHHVYLLREAGLLDEAHRSGAIVLSVRRSTIDCLGVLTARRLFGDGEKE